MNDEERLDIDAQDEWIEEEIEPAEVEMVISTIVDLMQKVKSEIIREHLDSAYESIVGLADWEDDDEHADAA